MSDHTSSETILECLLCSRFFQTDRFDIRGLGVFDRYGTINYLENQQSTTIPIVCLKVYVCSGVRGAQSLESQILNPPNGMEQGVRHASNIPLGLMGWMGRN